MTPEELNIKIQQTLSEINKYANNLDDLVINLEKLGIKDFERFTEEAGKVPVHVSKEILNNLPEAFRARQDYLKEEERQWQQVNKESIEDLEEFYKVRFPKGNHKEDAETQIGVLKGVRNPGIVALEAKIKSINANKQKNNPDDSIYKAIVDSLNDSRSKLTTAALLQAISNDNNFISGIVANKLLTDGIITDFSPTGIDEKFISCIKDNVQRTTFDDANPLNSISRTGCTEVYFWGIPSSGKTCALGAILSAASNGKGAKYLKGESDKCNDYGYMTQLKALFKKDGKIKVLPKGTPTTSTYEMGFSLVDKKGRHHPITCVDLAGELLKIMWKAQSKKELQKEEQEVLARVHNMLVDNRTVNRKMHFFVIEYGAEDRKYEGMAQADILDSATDYIQSTKILEKDTDAIFILVTKVDKLKLKGPQLYDKLRGYLKEYYEGFYGRLDEICRKNYINGGKVDPIPFTLGQVCFQDYCKFDDKCAEFVVETIIKRSFVSDETDSSSFLGKLWRRVKKFLMS